MTDNRPTFSESWYRVADLTPCFPTSVKVRNQSFRGKKWAVLRDPVNNDFFRLSDTAYYFAAMLDGRHTVAQVWQQSLDRFGDDAPTQDEVIRILGQLYQANLLQTTIPPDAQSLFRRYRQRRRREVQGFLLNLLFVRIPLWDPDQFLDVWSRFFGHFFSRTGLMLWLIVIAAGLWTLLGRVDALGNQASALLNPKNIPLLYLSLVLLKIGHEMGHALACKHFGRMEGTGGEVHQMGVTFLIFTPLPFVDASGAWAFKSKLRRMVVSASGMMVEFAVAAVAAFVWSRTAEGSTAHAIAYNLMFVASISTLLFNGNPFLRYDAYYLLSDLLEIPNLEPRSKLYAAYLIKRYIWGMDNAHDPSHAKGEKKWLCFYALASILTRLLIMVVITVTIGSRLAVVGMVIAALLFFSWVVVPAGKLIRYLTTSRELIRVRPRAVATSILASAGLVTAVGLVNLPDRCRIEGVVEPAIFAEIYIQTAGFVHTIQKSGTWIESKKSRLIQAENPVVDMQRKSLLADLRHLNIRRQMAQTQGAAAVQVLEEKIAAVAEQLERNRQQTAALSLTSPISGTWISPEAEGLTGRFLERGHRIGMVASLEALQVRAVAGQKEAARLIQEAHPLVEMRVKGRPDIALPCRIKTILPAGHEQLPSAALGYAAGGATQTDAKDPSGRRAAEPFFEIIVEPLPESRSSLRPGQRVVLRFETRPRPLLVQGWRELLQLFQPRFKV